MANPPPPTVEEELDKLLEGLKNEESTKLALQYFVIPGYSGRYELFSCNRSLEGLRGERFRGLVARIAAETGLDAGLLAVNAAAEHDVSIYLAMREVQSQEVGLDYWSTLRHGVLASGVPGVDRIRARAVPHTVFTNEAGNDVPVWAFRDGGNALLAFAALLKLYENRIIAAAGASLPKVTRFALVRYAYNASPQRALDLARQAGAGSDVLPTRGAPGPHNPLRTATIRAVQAISVGENYFGGSH